MTEKRSNLQQWIKKNQKTVAIKQVHLTVFIIDSWMKKKTQMYHRKDKRSREIKCQTYMDLKTSRNLGQKGHKLEWENTVHRFYIQWKKRLLFLQLGWNTDLRSSNVILQGEKTCNTSDLFVFYQKNLKNKPTQFALIWFCDFLLNTVVLGSFYCQWFDLCASRMRQVTLELLHRKLHSEMTNWQVNSGDV